MKLLHEARVFPGYRYQWADTEVAYAEELEAASRTLEVYDTALEAVSR